MVSIAPPWDNSAGGGQPQCRWAPSATNRELFRVRQMAQPLIPRCRHLAPIVAGDGVEAGGVGNLAVCLPRVPLDELASFGTAEVRQRRPDSFLEERRRLLRRKTARRKKNRVGVSEMELRLTDTNEVRRISRAHRFPNTWVPIRIAPRTNASSRFVQIDMDLTVFSVVFPLHAHSSRVS
jgi:hypothetical protein